MSVAIVGLSGIIVTVLEKYGQPARPLISIPIKLMAIKKWL
jgi:hypothetical protein